MSRRMGYTVAFDAPAEKIYQDFYSASVTHAPGHLGGQYFLSETDTGSKMRLTGECKVYIPFVGGKLEQLILHGMKGLFDAEEEFTADWIRKHH
jgi:Protein of unknown function (DUF2505)